MFNSINGGFTNWLTMFNPNFPTTFTDAASYLEQLQMCYKKMYEVLVYVQGLKDEINTLVESESKKQAAITEKKLQAEIDALEQEIQDSENRLRELIHETNSNTVLLINKTNEIIRNEINLLKSTFENEIQLIMNQLQNQIDLQDNMNELFIQRMNELNFATQSLRVDFSNLEKEQIIFKDHVNQQFSNLTDELVKKIDEQIARVQGNLILVTNPLTGQTDQLRDVLNDIAQYKQPFPITFEQFNTLRVTFEEFNAMNIRFIDFNNFAALIFWKDLNYPPFQKQIESLQKEIDELKSIKWWDYLNGDYTTPFEAYKHLVDFTISIGGTPITFDAFNERNYTFEQFNAWELTMKQFNVDFRQIVDGKENENESI